ncbi:DUF2630 family protein [Actinomadura latina]|uniref:DUF2630 family protein n=1 Tax=Actinomadura latina TaxID=163603 RepID=A0A846Z949_9ACTN|nr:DUF2630 family protein [Actinomadura latina]NKZ07722.1 DUF2630 family protein [Actinomadura latina]
MDEKDIPARIDEYVGEEQRLRERFQRDELGGREDEGYLQ